jgi:phage shock protein PspC (stress-responsive transcriptional regulator)
MATKLTRLDKKRFYRPIHGRKIAGVASGIANYFSIDVTIIRILWILLLLPGGLPGILPYILFWIVMPSEDEV